MQLPSNKVGFVLIFVVLSVASTIFFTKIGINDGLTDLQNVELLVGRNTDTIRKSGDADEDGLADWQEELWKTDPSNPDTDGDGTDDGAEIAADRDPSVKGPNDILIQPSDYFQSEVDFSNFASGTVSDKLSVDLFSKYLNLKLKGDVTGEQQTKLADDVAQKIAGESQLKNYFSMGDLTIVASTKESVAVYGDEFAQTSVRYLKQMDSYKNLSEGPYLKNMSQTYKDFAMTMSQIDVPTVTQDVHIQIINQLYKAGIMFDYMTRSDQDPVSAMMIIGQYDAGQKTEGALYTSLAQYYKNNGIIFTDTVTINFWKSFE